MAYVYLSRGNRNAMSSGQEIFRCVITDLVHLGADRPTRAHDNPRASKQPSGLHILNSVADDE